MSAKEKTQPPATDSGAEGGLPPGVKLLRTLEGHQGQVLTVAFDPQGGTLASGSDDSTVKLWGAVLVRHTCKGHWAPICSVAFDPQGQALASGSSDRTVKLWDVCKGGGYSARLKGTPSVSMASHFHRTGICWLRRAAIRQFVCGAARRGRRSGSSRS